MSRGCNGGQGEREVTPPSIPFCPTGHFRSIYTVVGRQCAVDDFDSNHNLPTISEKEAAAEIILQSRVLRRKFNSIDAFPYRANK
jgi:hypothetical protein